MFIRNTLTPARINFLIWGQSETAGSSGDGANGFESHQSSTVGIDFGIIGGLRDKYWVGGYLTNINSPMLGNINLPRKISISLGFMPTDNIYTNLSMERLLGRNDRQVKLGMKYDLSSTLSVISGVQSNPNRFGVGFEYKIFNTEIDQGVVLMCSRDLIFQRFELTGENFVRAGDAFMKKLDLYNQSII